MDIEGNSDLTEKQVPTLPSEDSRYCLHKTKKFLGIWEKISDFFSFSEFIGIFPITQKILDRKLTSVHYKSDKDTSLSPKFLQNIITTEAISFVMFVNK